MISDSLLARIFLLILTLFTMPVISQSSSVTALPVSELEMQEILLYAVQALSPHPPSWRQGNPLPQWAGINAMEVIPGTPVSPEYTIYSVEFGPTAHETFGFFTNGYLQWDLTQMQFLPIGNLSFMGIKRQTAALALTLPSAAIVPRLNLKIEGCERFVEPAAPGLEYFYARDAFESIIVTDCPLGGTGMLWNINQLDDERRGVASLRPLKQLTFRNVNWTGGLFIPVDFLEKNISMDFRGNAFGSFLSTQPPSRIPSLKIDDGIPFVQVPTVTFSHTVGIAANYTMCAKVEQKFPGGRVLPNLHVLSFVDQILVGKSGTAHNGWRWQLQSYYASCSSLPTSGSAYWTSNGIVIDSPSVVDVFNLCLYPDLLAVFQTVNDVMAPFPVPMSDYYVAQYLRVRPDLGMAVEIVASNNRSRLFSSDTCGTKLPMTGTGWFSLTMPDLFIQLNMRKDGITMQRFSAGSTKSVECFVFYPMFISDTEPIGRDGGSTALYTIANGLTVINDMSACLPPTLTLSKNKTYPVATLPLVGTGQLSLQLELGGDLLDSYGGGSTKLNLIHENETTAPLLTFVDMNSSWPVMENLNGFFGDVQIKLFPYANSTSLVVQSSTTEVCHYENLLLYQKIGTETSVVTLADGDIYLYFFQDLEGLSSSFQRCLKSAASRSNDKPLELLGFGCLDPTRPGLTEGPKCRGNSTHFAVLLPHGATSVSQAITLRPSSDDFLPVSNLEVCGTFGSGVTTQIKLSMQAGSIAVTVSNFSFGFWLRDECQVEGVIWYGNASREVYPGAFRYPPSCFPTNLFGDQFPLQLPFRQGGSFFDDTLTLVDQLGAKVTLSAVACSSITSGNVSQCPADLNQFYAPGSVNIADRFVVSTTTEAEARQEMATVEQDNEAFYSTAVLRTNLFGRRLRVPLADPGRCVAWEKSLIPTLLDKKKADPRWCFDLAGVGTEKSSRAAEQRDSCAIELWNCSTLAQVITDSATCLLFSGHNVPTLMRYPTTLPTGFSKTSPFSFENSSASCSDGEPGAERLKQALRLAQTPKSQLQVAIHCLSSNEKSNAALMACTQDNTSNSVYLPVLLPQRSRLESEFTVECTGCLPYTTAISHAITLTTLAIASAFTAVFALLARILNPKLVPLVVWTRLQLLELLKRSTPEKKEENRKFLARENSPALKTNGDIVSHSAETAEIIEAQIDHEHYGDDVARRVSLPVKALGRRTFARSLQKCCELTARLLPIEAELGPSHLDQTEAGRKGRRLLNQLKALHERCVVEARDFLKDPESHAAGASTSKRAKRDKQDKQPGTSTSEGIDALSSKLLNRGMDSTHSHYSEGTAKEEGEVEEMEERNESSKVMTAGSFAIDTSDDQLTLEIRAERLSNYLSETGAKEFKGTVDLVKVYSPETFLVISRWSDMLLEPAGWYLDLQTVILLVQFVVAVYASSALDPPVSYSKYEDLYFRMLNSPSVGPLMANLWFTRARELGAIRAEVSLDGGSVSWRARLQQWRRMLSAVVFKLRFFVSVALLLPVLVTHIIPGVVIFFPMTLTLSMLVYLSTRIVRCLPALTADSREVQSHEQHGGDRGRKLVAEKERYIVLSKPTNLFRIVVSLLDRSLKVLTVTLVFQLSFNYMVLFFSRRQFPWFAGPTTGDLHQVETQTTNVVFSDDPFFRYFEVFLVDYFRRKNFCLEEIFTNGYAPNIIQQFAITG